jgi:hypothetical protein
MDDHNPPECSPNKEQAKSSWAKTGIKPKIANVCVEIEIPGIARFGYRVLSCNLEETFHRKVLTLPKFTASLL